MRVKAIPMEAVHFIESNPALFIGVGVVCVGGYIYIQRAKKTTISNTDETTSTAGTSYGSYGSYLPISSGAVATGGGYTGLVDSTTATNTSTATTATPASSTTIADGSVTALDLFNFEKQKESDTYDLSLFGLQSQLAIAQAQAYVQLAGIQSANYSTSAQLAQTYLTSNKNFAIGSISGDAPGSAISFGFVGADKGTGGKYDKSDIQFNNEINNPVISALIQKIGSNNVQSSVGSGTATPYAGSGVVPTLQSGGSGLANTVNGGSSVFVQQKFGDAYNVAEA